MHHRTCWCLPCMATRTWNICRRAAILAMSAQRLLDDLHADIGLLLACATAEAASGQNMPQIFTNSTTQVGSASRLMTNPRVNAGRTTLTACTPTCSSVQISMVVGSIISGNGLLCEEERRRLNTWFATLSANFLSWTMRTTSSPEGADESDICEMSGCKDNCLNQYREDLGLVNPNHSRIR